MGEIYRATDDALGRAVAIKLLAERFAEDVSIRQRFTREALAAARLSGQPNTVRLDELDVICAVLGCEVGELLLPEPVAMPEPATSQSTGAVAEARAVTPRSRTGRSLPPR